MSIDWILIRMKACAEYVQYSEELEPVKGYLHNLQGFLLMLLAEQGPGTGAIVEIGSFTGKSTCWLARGAKRNHREKVYAVDHFTGSPEHQPGNDFEEPLLVNEGTTYNAFQQNIRSMGVEDYVIPIVARSEEAARDWDKPIRLLFIDGDHSYDASRLDFELWSPHVVPGGVIVFHDIGHWEGVTRFYEELVQNSTDYRKTLALESMRVLTKEK